MQMPPCKHLASKGFCRNQESGVCKFTHDTRNKEIFKPKMDRNGENRPVKKTRMCKNWEEGTCTFGDRCSFAHGEIDIEVAKNPMYKTTMCSKVKKGECDRGAKCIFAHDESELRVLLRVPEKKDIVCKFFGQPKGCKDGDRCIFAHSQDRWGFAEPVMGGNNNFIPGISMMNPMMGQGMNPMMGGMGQNGGNMMAGFNGGMADGGGRAEPPRNPATYKVYMCRRLIEEKTCRYGDTCDFAHSLEEMRPMPPPQPGYKDSLCKFFEEKKECKWGKDCKFAHGKKEMIKHTTRPGQFPTLCTKFVEQTCLYGINCSFSHQIPKQNPDWKVWMCKNGDDCKYAASCVYAHSDKELRTGTINRQLLDFYERQGEQIGGGGQSSMGGMGDSMMANMGGMGGGQMMGGNQNMMRNMGNSLMMDNMGGSMMDNQLNMMTNMGRNQGMMGDVGGSMMGGGNQNMMGSGGQNMMGSGGQNMMGSGGQNMMGSGGQNMMGSGGQNMMGGGSQNRIGQGWESDSLSGQKSTNIMMGGGINFGQSSQPSSNKGVLCPIWLEDGSCLEPSCSYAHGQKEIIQFNNQKRSFQDMSGGGGGSDRRREDPPLDGKYKVVMCDKFQTHCDMGERCNYAHGYEELKFYRLKQVPNYKKTLCKSFDETGSCQWNMTCMFAHGTHELRLEDELVGGRSGGAGSSSGGARSSSGGGGGHPALYYDRNKDYNYRDEKRRRF